MKRFVLASVVLLLSLNAFSQENTANFKWYGFIRNYFAYDSREMVSGTEDFFTYLPKDIKMDPTGTTDLNDISSFRFAALTSRLGVDVSGYAIEGWKVGAKIEADFYSGVSGVTGTAQFRLRQAYLTMAKNDWTLKAGQAWHPFAADIPDVFSLNAGAPFTPFNRTPLVQVNRKVNDKFSYDFAVIWQMQYTSAGPNGQKADYIKYSKTPELNAGVTYKSGGFTAKAGYNFLSIKPRNFNAAGIAKVDDRISTSAAYVFAQYVKGDLSGEDLSKSAGDLEGLVYVGAAVEIEANGTRGETGKFVWFSSPALADEAADMYVSGGNSSVFMATVNWMSENKTSLSILAKQMQVEALTVPEADAGIWSIIVIFVIPLTVFAWGFIVWFRRRKR